MTNKLFVGMLSYDVDDKGLAEIFQSVGTVQSAKVIMDRETGRSKGFGFVEMASSAEAQKAIKELNNTVQAGRTISVSEAKPQERSGGGGGSRQNGKRDRRGW